LKTDPQALLTLLELQRADLLLERLIARRESLPEARQAKESATAAASARDRAVLRRTEARDLQREVAKLEDEVQRVRSRAERDAEMLAGGSAVSARQMTDLQHEIASLQRRQSDLEDAELELMERAEQAEDAQRAAEAERDEMQASAEKAAAAAGVALAALEQEHQQTQGERERLAAAVPGDLLGLYDKVRANQGGIGAAEFANNECGGCRLQMIPADVAAVKAAPVDEVLRCEECGRILIRTEQLVA
jgi:predicted  nucleic acid-binding Zn-ribbon protein